MNKREEIIKELQMFEAAMETLAHSKEAKESIRLTFIESVLSITSRVKCPECHSDGVERACCDDCKDGWVYPIFLTPDEARIIRELVHSEGGKNWKKIRDGLIRKVKQAIKGE